MNAQELIKQVQERHNWSRNQVGKELGITSAAISNLAQEKIDGSDETYIKLAKLAGVDPTEVIIEKHMRKAGPEGQKIWAHLAKALPKSAALLIVVSLIVPFNQTDASTIQILQATKYLLCKINLGKAEKQLCSQTCPPHRNLAHGATA